MSYQMDSRGNRFEVSGFLFFDRDNLGALENHTKMVVLPASRIIEVIRIEDRAVEPLIVTHVERHTFIGFVGNVVPHLALARGVGMRGDAIGIAERELDHPLIEAERDLALLDQFLLLRRAAVEGLRIFLDPRIRRGATRKQNQTCERED